jgi:hypothetical protein
MGFSPPKGLYSLIAQRRHEIIEQMEDASDPRVRADLQARIRYLNNLRREAEAAVRPTPRQTVFISYSKGTGGQYFEIASKIAAEHGFTVLTGFSNEGENVLGVVRDALGKASVFLGIFTPEYNINTIKETAPAQTAPSVWLMEEKGMALALQKPFRLLVERTVHEDFWKRTTPDKLHTHFAPYEFHEKAEEAFEALSQRYTELLEGMMSR